MDLSLRMLADASLAQGAFKDLGSAATAAASIIKDFAADSIKAFGEAERVSKQLARVAGDLAPAFEKQADAMSKALSVEDEDVKRVQTLLLTYGAAPAQIEATTKALFDYAALTGNDVVSATTQLIHGVESGSGSIRKMGIEFKSTGSFAQDLAKATENLGGKVGGAAETAADTLEGRTRRASIAWNELKESVGGLFGLVESKLGILEKLAKGIESVKDNLDKGDWKALLKQYGKLSPAAPLIYADEYFNPSGAEKAGLVPLPPERDWGAKALPTSPLKGDHAVGKEKKDKGKDDWGWGPFGDPEKEFAGWQREYNEEKQKEIDDLAATALQVAAQANKERESEDKAEAKHDEEMLKQKRATADMELQIQTDADRRAQHEIDKTNAESKRKFDQQAEMWKRAGDQMGAALVNAIGAQLQRLAEGGDVDPAEMAGDVVSTILSIAGFAIGTYLGAPQVGGAIGGLAGSLAKTGIVAAAGKHKKHDGGWIERFHGGGWPMGTDEVPIIAQTGERVLSRAEVSRMGGPKGVESAARGGRSVVVNISAMDSQSFQDGFGRDAGRGFFNAIRVGRGDLVPLFSR
jgi:hypothetical protein